MKNNIRKYNKPAARVQNVMEGLADPEDLGGTKDCFKELDTLIARGEQAEQREKAYKSQELEKEFRKRLYTELKKKSIGQMTWQECELWNDLQHSEEHFYTPDVAKRYAEIHKAEMPTSAHAPTGGRKNDNEDSIRMIPGDEDGYEDGSYLQALFYIETCLKILPELESFYPEEIPKLTQLFMQLVQTIKREMQQQNGMPSNNDMMQSIIQECCKSLVVTKAHNSTIVSGWSGIESVDSAGDVLSMEQLKKNLNDFYMNDGKICLNHDTSKIIGKLRSYEFKPNKEGTPGLYVNAELSPEYQYLESDILNGRLKGFSWSFRAERQKTCQRDKCFNNLNVIPNSISELSIVEYPCQPGAVIENLHEAS